MTGSKLEAAAIAWHEARLQACAAPLEGFVKDKKGDSIAVPNPSVWTALGAAETALSEAVKARLAFNAEQARLAARPKLFITHGWQHGGRFTEESCTLEEAIRSARVACEWCYWRPEEIRTVAGDLVLGERELYDRIWADEAAA